MTLIDTQNDILVILNGLLVILNGVKDLLPDPRIHRCHSKTNPDRERIE